MNDLILVTGATGQQGGAVIRYLLRAGQKVRAFTRHPEKAEHLKTLGVEVVQGDLTDEASVKRALQGIKRMFLVTTPYEAGTDIETKQGISAVEAAKEAGLEHLVYSSVGSAQRNTAIPHFDSKRAVELRIQELGIRNTIIRPVFFMDNFGAPWALPMAQQGIISFPMMPETRLAMVAVDNVGDYIAQALLHPEKYLGQEIELAGEELTIPKAAEIISRATGKKIVFQQLPDESAEKVFGHDFAEMFRWFDKVGYNPDIPMLEKKHGIRLTRFAEYIKTAPWVEQVRASVTTPNV